MHLRLRRLVLVGSIACVPALGTLLGLAGTATASTAAPQAVRATQSTPSAQAAPGPSPQARQVSEDEAEEDIALTLGVKATTVGPPTYAAGTSTCRYTYPRGGFTLSVQDLPDVPGTARAYDAVGARMGHVQDIDLQGARAYTTTNGSVVMQKDTKVLLTDVTDLPDPFGTPPVSRAGAALLITKAVLGCWTE